MQNFRQISPHHVSLLFVLLISFCVHHQQPGLLAASLDPPDNLLMIFIADVGAVHLHDTIAWFQARGFSRRAFVNFSDELARFPLLRMQIEAVAVKIRPSDDVTESGNQARTVSHFELLWLVYLLQECPAHLSRLRPTKLTDTAREYGVAISHSHVTRPANRRLETVFQADNFVTGT